MPRAYFWTILRRSKDGRDAFNIPAANDPLLAFANALSTRYYPHHIVLPIRGGVPIQSTCLTFDFALFYRFFWSHSSKRRSMPSTLSLRSMTPLPKRPLSTTSTCGPRRSTERYALARESGFFSSEVLVYSFSAPSVGSATFYGIAHAMLEDD